MTKSQKSNCLKVTQLVSDKVWIQTEACSKSQHFLHYAKLMLNVLLFYVLQIL